MCLFSRAVSYLMEGFLTSPACPSLSVLFLPDPGNNQTGPRRLPLGRQEVEELGPASLATWWESPTPRCPLVPRAEGTLPASIQGSALSPHVPLGFFSGGGKRGVFDLVTLQQNTSNKDPFGILVPRAFLHGRADRKVAPYPSLSYNQSELGRERGLSTRFPFVRLASASISSVRSRYFRNC